MPTTKLFPATIEPKVSMIFPASAFRRMSLVDATFRESLKRVTNRRRLGKLESSRASFDDSVTISTASASEMLHARRVSSMMVGNGMSRVASTAAMPITITTFD